MKLNEAQCEALHVRNAGKRVWLDQLAINDGRIVVLNADETLYIFTNAEYDQTEQAQAARLCAALNQYGSRFAPVTS